jgi:glycosyltransferase involved in cell wall biosynthesis
MTARPCPRLVDLPAPPPGRRGWPWDVETPPIPDAGELPTISIVTPSYNQAAFAEATLRSVLLQGYPRVELVVMDGGSTDGAVDVVKRYERWLARWVSEKDRGQSDAINKGLESCTGQVLGWLNTDDRLRPGALQGVARAFVARPDAAAWAGRGWTVTAEGRPVYPQIPRGLTREGLADWGHEGQLLQPACFFSRAAVEKVGAIDERYHYAMDVEFWIRLAGAGPFVGVDEEWAEETQHPEAKTWAQRGKSLAELHLVQIRAGFEDLAFRRMSEELQDYEQLRRGTWVERAKRDLNLLLRPLLSRSAK